MMLIFSLWWTVLFGLYDNACLLKACVEKQETCFHNLHYGTQHTGMQEIKAFLKIYIGWFSKINFDLFR